MASYKKTSPWFNTKQNNLYLELLEIRPVPAEADDFLYTIEGQYKHRPDLLAFDLYGDAKLWWVFTQRNMTTILDPIFDFVPGTQIYVPKKSNLQKYLGV
jgi:Base plate wedge protein 53